MNDVKTVIDALHDAVTGGDARAVDLLLMVHQPLVNITDRFGRTPLHLAVIGNHPDVVRVLMQRGAEINVKDPCGLTALDIARRDGHTEIVQSLAGNWRP